jgi:ATP-dependent Clp protease ATP-binding subunit ClpA
MDGSSFTPQLRKALAAARDVAEDRHQREVQTVHLALGVISVPEGGAAVAVLTAIGIDTASLRERQSLSVRSEGSAHSDRAELAYTLEAKRTVELAVAEARDMKHDRTSTAHLLIAILRRSDAAVAGMLSDARVTVERVRAETQRLAVTGDNSLGEMITSTTPQPS